MAGVTPEELLEHAGWMRGLAARLVGDAATADDIVQSAWLAAIRRPPRGDRSVRPWLRTVLRNLVRQRHREETRRRAREREAGGRHGHHLPSPEVLAGRLETQRLLARLVAELDEPYRSTVLLRFYEGLTSADIARRVNVPAGTVRWRLKQAVDRLRERLDREHDGDRRAWLLGLLPFAAEAKTVVPAAAPVAGIAVLAAILLLFCGAGLWLSGVFSVDEPGRSDASPRTMSDASAGDPSTTSGEATAGSEGGVTSVSTRAGKARRHRCAFRVIHEDGRPIPAARVHVGSRWKRREAATSDPSGAVAFECADGHPHLMISATGRASRFLRPKMRSGEITHLGDVTLGPGGAVSGQVRDTTGRPVPDAWVYAATAAESGAFFVGDEIAHGPSATDALPTADTGPQGRFRIDGVPPGFPRVWAKARGRIWACSPPKAVRGGEEATGVEITILSEEEAPRIEGTVLAPDGSPAVGTRVRAEVHVPGMSATDLALVARDGRFRIVAPGAKAVEIRVLDPRNRWAETSTRKISIGRHDVVIRLEDVHILTVRVTNPQGEPVTKLTVHVYEAERDLRLEWGSLRRYEGGIVRIPAPSRPFRIGISAPGCPEVKRGPFAAGTIPETLDLTLTLLPGLRGRVTANDKPVARAWIRAYRLYPRRQVAFRGPFRLRMDNAVLAETRSGEDGTFSLAPRTARRIVLRVEADAHAPAELGPYDYEPSIGRSAIEVRLGPGGVLEGEVLVRGDGDPSGTLVGVSRGDPHPRSVRVGPDGRFRFERLTPGPWVVDRVDEEVHRGAGSFRTGMRDDPPEHPVSCVVREGETVRFDLDLRERGPVVLLGRLTTNGGPPGKSTVSLYGARPHPAEAEVGLDTTGRFRLGVPEAGRYRLYLSTEGGGAISDVLVLTPGENSWELDLTPGVLAGFAPAATMGPVLYHLWRGRGDLALKTAIRPGPNGAFRLDAAPAGSGWIVRQDDAGWNDLDAWTKVRAANIPPGGRLEIDLR